MPRVGQIPLSPYGAPPWLQAEYALAARKLLDERRALEAIPSYPLQVIYPPPELPTQIITPNGEASPVPVSLLLKWLNTHSDGVIPLPGYRERTGPFRYEQEPRETGRYLPFLYDYRASDVSLS